MDRVRSTSRAKKRRSCRKTEHNSLRARSTTPARMSAPRRRLCTRTAPVSSPSLNSRQYGRLVWGKIPGSRIWPGIIVNEELCGMRPLPNEKSVLLFWFGDNRISIGSLSQTYDFVDNFDKFFSLKNAVASFRRGIIDILMECRERASLPVLSYQPLKNDMENLIEWARDGFPNPSKSSSIFLSRCGRDLPPKVAKLIDQIRKDRILTSNAKEADLRFTNSNDHFPTSSSSSESDSDTEERRKWRTKAALLKKARQGTAFLDSFCIACEKGEDTSVVAPHPLFQGGLCQQCKVEYDGRRRGSDIDYVDFFCSVCSSPGEVFVCDNSVCEKVYCVGCIELFVSPSAVDTIRATDPWACFFCTEYNQRSHGLLIPRKEAVNTEHEKQLHLKDFQIPVLPANDDAPTLDKYPKRPLRVLSLFDGIATGMFVLRKLDLAIESYVASEIDIDAMNVARMNFGTDVRHLGDIQDFSDKQIEALCPIDLLIGGSPCNDLSIVNPNRKGLYDPTGTGVLFFHFFRVQKVVERFNGERHLFWLYENVASMPKECKRQISLFLQREPVFLDAKYFSAQKRARLYWGNIPDMWKGVPEGLSSQDYTLKQSLLAGCERTANVDKLNCVTTNANSLTLNKGLDYPISMAGRPDVPWITEIEKVFGFPPHYTDVGNLGVRDRQALLGKAWSVQVVLHLLSPITKYFSSCKDLKSEELKGIDNKEEESEMVVAPL